MTTQEPSKSTRSDAHDRQGGTAATGQARWLRLLVFLNAGALLCMAVFLVRGVIWSPQVGKPADDLLELKVAAQALEDRGLDASAAAAWQRYLDAAPEDPERAEILYHAGELHMRAEQYEPAAADFVRAEQAAGENKELAAKIEPRLIECLGGMGRFGEVGRELSRRRQSGAKKSDDRQVVATIGTVEITDSQLDRMVEEHVDQMLAAKGLSGDRLRRQMALRQASSPNVRARILHDLVEKEIFLRRARELKLDRDKDFLAAREQATQALLLQKLQAHELKLAAPTDAAMEAFYKEHQADYRQPDKLDVLGIRVADGKAAAALLEKIKSADDFRKLAQEIRQSGSPNGQVTFVRSLFRGQPDPVLGETDALFAMSEGQWTKEPITRGSNTLLVLVETKTAARTPSFAEVKQYVQDRYIQQKKSQALEKLFRELAARYDVDVKLAVVPERGPRLPGTEQFLAEPGATAAGTGTSVPKPDEKETKPQQKPDNPLRSPDAPQEPRPRKEKPAAKAAAPEAPTGTTAAKQSDNKRRP